MWQLYTFAAKIKPGDVGVPTTTGDNLIGNVLDLVYFFFGAAAIISIVISGIMYTVSGGDANMVKQAKNGVLYGVIGLVVALMAFVITGFIIGSFE